jgi:hypothetical protein
MSSSQVAGRILESSEIVDVLEREGWQGPDLGVWRKSMGGVTWVARTVVLYGGKAGLLVTLAAS